MLRRLLKIGFTVGIVILAAAVGLTLYPSLSFNPNGLTGTAPAITATSPAGPTPTQANPELGTETAAPPSTANTNGPATSPSTDTERQASGANPWDTATLQVAIRNQAAPERNLTPAVTAATAYWEGEGRQYAAYPVSFQIVPESATPDLIVWYNHTIQCATHSDAIGCAPLLNESANPSPPEDVQIRYDPTDNERQVRNTLIHEFGHILGVTHCDDPDWVMGPSCPDQSRPTPDVDERPFAWRDGDLTVFVDNSAVTDANQAETTTQVNHALEYFRTGAGETVPPNVTFDRVTDPWQADLVIRFVEAAACDPEAVVCISGTGRDIDNDGALEYHTKGEITVEQIDVDARGWYVGWALARLLTPDGVPTVLENGASYDTRRSAWYE